MLIHEMVIICQLLFDMCLKPCPYAFIAGLSNEIWLQPTFTQFSSWKTNYLNPGQEFVLAGNSIFGNFFQHSYPLHAFFFIRTNFIRTPRLRFAQKLRTS